MQSLTTTSDKWLIVQLAGVRFGLEVSHVREMTTLRDKRIVATPCRPRHLAGVLKLRNRVLPVVDLRVLLGMPSMADESAELLSLLDAREQDHVNWLRALEQCIQDKSAFTLATDPHKCKFGKWYDALMADAAEIQRLANNDSGFERMLVELLRQFDAPHQRIHAIAVRVTTAVAEGRVKEAAGIIDKTRTTDLASMIALFAEARRTVLEHRKPLVVVLETGERVLAGLVDSLDAVYEVSADQTMDCADARVPREVIAGFVALGPAQDTHVTTLLRTGELLDRALPATVEADAIAAASV